MEFDDEGTKDIVCAIRTMVQEKKMGTPDEFLQVLRMHQLASCFDHKTRLYSAGGTLRAGDGRAGGQ